MTAERQSVAVVITTYNDPKYLAEAVRSVIAQTQPVDEIIVVDDGSEVSPAPVLAGLPGVVLLRKENGGLASARNWGMQHARSSLITFLDADDRLTGEMVASSLACFSGHPTALMIYGGHRRIGATGHPLARDSYKPIGKDPYAELLSGNCIGMHATVMYRRSDLLALGGFDESLRRCEDYDLYLRVAQSYPVASHPDTVAEYRWHGANMSTNRKAMLKAALAVHDRHRDQPPSRRAAWHRGQRNLLNWYRKEQRNHWNQGKSERTLYRRVHRVTRSVLRRVKGWLRHGRLHRVSARLLNTWPPPLGMVKFGSLSSTRPVSDDFGWDRGTPIDRFYIEAFLQKHQADIAGSAFEIGDSLYCSQFGEGKITHQDVLHLDSQQPRVTLIGNLTVPGVLPRDAYDCMILTQTLQYIFDLKAAVEHIVCALKPGGVLLLTVPGITQIDRGPKADLWCWSFTNVAIRKLFAETVPSDCLQVEAHGNVFAAVAYLHGAALEEIDRGKLDFHDPAYPVLVTLRLQKPV